MVEHPLRWMTHFFAGKLHQIDRSSKIYRELLMAGYQVYPDESAAISFLSWFVPSPLRIGSTLLKVGKAGKVVRGLAITAAEAGILSYLERHPAIDSATQSKYAIRAMGTAITLDILMSQVTKRRKNK